MLEAKDLEVGKRYCYHNKEAVTLYGGLMPTLPFVLTGKTLITEELLDKELKIFDEKKFFTPSPGCYALDIEYTFNSNFFVRRAYAISSAQFPECFHLFAEVDQEDKNCQPLIDSKDRSRPFRWCQPDLCYAHLENCEKVVDSKCKLS